MEASVLNSLIHHYRSFARRYRERLDHDRLFDDPRISAEHRLAHQRVLANGGEGCPYCLDF